MSLTAGNNCSCHNSVITSLGSCGLSGRTVGKCSRLAQLRLLPEVEDDQTNQDGGEDDDEEGEKDDPAHVDAIVVDGRCVGGS